MRALRSHSGLSIAFIAANLVIVTIALAQSQRSLNVSVITKRGHPVPGVALVLAGDDRVRSGTTNAKGQFEFGDLPDLRFALDASYLDFPIAAMRDIELPKQGPKSLSITLDPPGGYFARGLGSGGECMLVNVESVPGGIGPISYDVRESKVSVAGTINILGPGLKTMAGRATIVALRADQPETPIAEVESDDRAEFHFDDLEPGKYRLRLSHKGSYTGTTIAFWVASQNTTRLGPVIMYPDHMTDMCGTSTEIMPFDDPVNPAPELELIDPNRKP